jgi:STE24 endopeptidase
VHPLIDVHRQERAILYERKKGILSILILFLSAGYLILFYTSGLSGTAGQLAATRSTPLALAFYMLFFFPLFVLILPITVVRDHIVERKFGLSTQSTGSWLLDNVKNFAIGCILGYPLIFLLFYFFTRIPQTWWVLGACAYFLFQLVVTIAFPVLLLPLFFRQQPIEEGSLAKKIEGLFKNTRVRIAGIFSFNLSSRTRKENAVLAGIWKTQRVLLADNLLLSRGEDEILIVVAHEIGHHVKKHMMKLALLGFCTSMVLFYGLHRIMVLFEGFPHDFGLTLTLFPLFVLFAGVLSFPIRVFVNMYIRREEREADRIALDLTHNPSAFVRLMAGLANTNLAVAHPKKLKVFFNRTHPSVGQRIEFALNYGRRF